MAMISFRRAPHIKQHKIHTEISAQCVSYYALGWGGNNYVTPDNIKYAMIGPIYMFFLYQHTI